MRPKLLKVSGLNSFVEEEIIDFAALTKKGLFGIFGPTGSGKSSILDAVTIALYGRISRDTKEFINKETEELYVFFEFSIGTDNFYTVERKLKISDTGGYKTSLSRLIVNENGQEEIYDKVNEIDNKIEEIIGLNHEDFMRTVVLPQGKFSRFLKLAGRTRRDMLERILGLEEFGERLMRKLKKQRNLRKNRLRGLIEVLNTYEAVSDKKLAEEKEKLSDLSTKYKNSADKLKEKTKEYDKYKQVRRLQDELEGYENRKEKLIEKKDEIEKKKIKLEKARKAVSIKSDLKRYEECNNDIKENKQELAELVKQIKQLSMEKDKLSKEYEILVEQKDKELPHLTREKVRINDALKLTEKNRVINKKIADKNKKIKGVKEKRDSLKSKLNKIKDKIIKQEKEIKNKEEELEELQVSPDYRKAINAGLELENNYRQQKKQLVESKKDKETVVKNIKDEKGTMSNLNKQLKEIEAALLQSYNQELEAKKAQKVGLNSKLSNLTVKLKAKQEKLEKIKQEIREIERKNMAGALASHLKEGAPCPVCGSSEHPDIAKEINVDLSRKNKEKEELVEIVQTLQNDKTELTPDLKVTENSIDSLIKERDSLVVSFSSKIEELQELKFTDIASRDQLKKDRNDIKEQINRLTGSLNKNEENLQGLDRKFKEQEIIVDELGEDYNKRLTELSIQNFARENKQITEKDKNLEKIQQDLKAIKKELVENKKNKEKMHNNYNEQDKELLGLENELKNLQEDFSDNKEEIKEKVGDEEPQEYLQQVEKREKELKSNIKKKKQEKEKTEEDHKNKENKKSTINDRLERLQKETDKLTLLLSKKIEEFNFKDIEQAKIYLEWEDNIKNWEQEIKEYEKQATNINNNINRLTDELAGASISKEKWAKIREEKSALEESQKKLQEMIGGQKKTIEKLKDDLKDKKKKVKEREELDHELALIKEIDDLIRGKSFVEFVAVRQLRYIAREASKRLMEITNNRYRLELNEQGEFVICDLYNGGVKRGCNTLSGGETFLTSLSLALALSSQIQLKGSSSMEFFFLDEGFGTLDNNLLDVVMNSLEKLQDEKLAVGIISHVEELKNRVPVKLMVEPAQPGLRGTKVEIKYS